jgi:gluconate 5-dehydrogenase
MQSLYAFYKPSFLLSWKFQKKVVTAMRIYIASDNDTLRKIAKKYQITLKNLCFLNPHIHCTDTNIKVNTIVKIPPLKAQQSNFQQPPSTDKTEHSNYLDHWVPLTHIEKMAQTEYDVLIVGSGAGGGAALWRLCQRWERNGKRIGIIEAGPLLLPTHGRNIPTFNHDRFTRFFDNPLHTEYIGKRWPDYPGARIIKALGGRMLQWFLLSPRLNPENFYRVCQRIVYSETASKSTSIKRFSGCN